MHQNYQMNILNCIDLTWKIVLQLNIKIFCNTIFRKSGGNINEKQKNYIYLYNNY